MKTITTLLMIGFLCSSRVCLAITVLFSAEHLALESVSPKSKSKSMNPQCNILLLLKQKLPNRKPCRIKTLPLPKTSINENITSKTQAAPGLFSRVEHHNREHRAKVLAADIAAIYMYR